MNTDKLFTRAVAALPKAVRTQLDGDAPLDWAALEDAGTAAELAEAARSHGRLPDSVEMLVSRLIADVGIACADLGAGIEGQGSPGAWAQEVAIEAEGESYRLLNRANGDLHAGIRVEAVAGYATLALELAQAVHEAGERWIEAGQRHQVAAEHSSSLLVLCAKRMREHLHAHLESETGRRTTAGLAAVLERAWNTQGFKTRAALSGIRLRAGRDARALRRSYYAPLAGYRLHAYDPGEVRWLRALAEQAAAAVDADKQDEQVPSVEAKTTTVKRAAPADDKPATDIYALEARIRAANEDAGTLQLGSPPEELMVDDELTELMGAASRLPSAVRRRMRESYGIGFTQALSRLRNSGDSKAVASEIKRALSNRTVPRWLHDLASTLLLDAGAQTRYGARTASVRLHREEASDAAYRAVESETEAVGQLTPLGLIEQVRLGFAFAMDAWRGHTALRSAGKESGWILDKGEAEGSDFSANERDVLEAARRIEHVLDRIQRAHGKQTATALEEAFMTAEAFRGVGPATCIAAGWPDTAEIPDPRSPEEVARIAAVAEALHEDIRAIANKFIASWVAVAKDYSADESDRASPQQVAAAPPNDSEAGSRGPARPAWTTRGPAADREWGQP